MTGGAISRILLVVLWTGTLGGAWTEARAQNNQFTERSFLASPAVLGMGDAGVALSGAEQSFFYNPAHLPRVSSHFTVFGLQGAATPSLDDHIRFFNRRLHPAIESGYELSAQRFAALRREARVLARHPSRGVGGVLLPSFVYSPGALGVGGGLFAKTAVNYRLKEGEGGVPSMWTVSRTDLMALASVGLDLRVLGLPALSFGLTGTKTRRYLAFKNELLGRIDRGEVAVQLEGETFQLDAGLTYTPRWLASLPGTVRLGGAVYDFLSRGYDYTPGGAARLPFLDEVVQSASDSTEADPRELQRAQSLFSLTPSYRVGVAYQLPSLFFLEDLGVVLDYQGYRSGEQSPLARLHLGARAALVGPLQVRAGLSAGYPSGGIGLEWRALHFDYSLHGVEEGRRPGQLQAYVHTARFMLRLE